MPIRCLLGISFSRGTGANEVKNKIVLTGWTGYIEGRWIRVTCQDRKKCLAIGDTRIPSARVKDGGNGILYKLYKIGKMGEQLAFMNVKGRRDSWWRCGKVNAMNREHGYSNGEY